jgi:glutaminyl-peptide cyclotransferase
VKGGYFGFLPHTRADRDNDSRGGGRQVRFHRVRVVRRLPHPGRGFTQGLIAEGDTVWESTGLYGESTLRRYRLGSETTDEQAPLPGELFGEGICRAGDHIWQLTWQERVALRWDPRTMTVQETVAYNREGWGICAAGDHVLTSDGSSELVRRDPRTLAPQKVIHVRCAGSRVLGLNDLAWSDGLVWANVAGTTQLAGIDPDSGEVTDIVEARAAAERHFTDPQAIMNGVAALSAAGEFLLTGKGWRSIRHVRLIPGRAHPRPELLLAGGWR